MTKHSEDQAAVVDLLKEALAQALEGNISSIGIIACMKAGYATVMAGHQASDLFMGCGSLQRKILGAVEDDGNIKGDPVPKSNIIRVRPGHD